MTASTAARVATLSVHLVGRLVTLLLMTLMFAEAFGRDSVAGGLRRDAVGALGEAS